VRCERGLSIHIKSGLLNSDEDSAIAHVVPIERLSACGSEDEAILPD
jgi:hypothetical protein